MEEFAHANDLEIVYPKPNELFIDIDKVEDYKVFEDLMWVVFNPFPFFEHKIFQSKTEGHYHIYATIADHNGPVVLTPLERCAMQACLGSDKEREFLTICRIRNGEENPTVFFKPKNTILPVRQYSYPELTDSQRVDLYNGKVPKFLESWGRQLNG